MRETADCRPGIDANFQPIHADAEVSSPVTRWVPCVPDRVLASGFSGRGLIGRVSFVPMTLPFAPVNRIAEPKASFGGVSGGVGVGVGVGVGGCAQYLPPVSKTIKLLSRPPQTIISLPVQTAVCSARRVGALVVLVAVQLSVLGLYLPPVSKSLPTPTPPQTIISLPVQTTV
jgi:hypothetical protein